jgi:DNA-binding transcriptional regulator GbsR (MarR family)
MVNSSEMSSLVLRAKAVKGKLIGTLQKHSGGLTITELVNTSGLSRSAILIELARLEGANEVVFRRAGMAKIYSLVGGDKGSDCC